MGGREVGKLVTDGNIGVAEGRGGFVGGGGEVGEVFTFT